ncbi:MAG: hypothetical protein IJT36_07315, partial [Alphaproteobacteria bacterium]|nr:hypothetical protein [Alphaproteobacteria bacterium]
REYAKLDGTPQGLKTSLKAMNPLNGLSKDEKKKFLKWISADDKKFLRRAMKYYQDLIKNF